jgi:hypothetical protein
MEEPILDPSNRQDFPETFNQPQQSWWDWFVKNNLIVVGGVALLVLLVVGGLWFWRDRANQEPENPNVVLSIKGPETLSAGNETEYRIVYTNGENADLTNITLEVFYPANFTFVASEPASTSSSGQRFDLPILRQGQSNEVVVKGKVSGATGESKELRAKLGYSMTNFTSTFYTEANFKTLLTAPQLEMEIVGPIDVTNGQNTTFTVNYKNVSNKPFDATAIELQYPEGFVFASAVPAPTRSQNYWSLGLLDVGATGKIEVTGSFIGDPGTEKQITGDLGLALNSGLAPQIHASARFKIKSSTLTIEQTTNPSEVAQLGRSIEFTLKYGNYGTVGQSNVVVEVVLDGAAIDLTRVRASNGIVTGNTISWKSATLPALGLVSPNQSGNINFSVPIKSTVSTNLTNQTIKSTAYIYSDQEVNKIRGEDVALKLGTELGLIVSGSYVNGPLPMRVGETTTFNMSLLLTNLSNDLSNTEVIASMPLPASAWVNVIMPEGEQGNITFDQNASKIRWRVGNLPAFTGRYSPARTVNFQLQVTPSEGDRGRTMTLLRDVMAIGTDTFTELEVKSTQVNTFTASDINDLDGLNSSVQ